VLNPLGFNLDPTDASRLMAGARLGFVALTLLGVLFLLRGRVRDRGAGLVIIGIGAAGHLLAWLATMLPLLGVYGMNGSMDRENHLGWANVVALGFSPFRTFQVGHIHFEPVWPLLTAIASGFDVEDVGLVFQLAPLVVGLALLVSVRSVWARGAGGSEGKDVEAAFAALGALLLMATPGDFGGQFRNPWAMTFLLKPNHSLGLILAPWAALAVARARDGKTRLLAGLALQFVGWAFVIHMALFVVGLMIFVAGSWLARGSDRVKDLLDVVTAVGVNLVLVSPYLAMLIVGYPFLHGSDAFRLSPFSERLFEAPLRMGAFFLLSAFGAWHAHRERGRMGRILAAQWLSAHLVWQAFPILGLFGQAREQDEIFYWCRFWTGLFAGVGAYQAANQIFSGLRKRDHGEPSPCGSMAAALGLVLLLPSLLAGWWDPAKMDQYFAAASRSLPDWIAEPTAFIRNHTSQDAVFAGDRNYARWIAAYGARRVLLANSLNAPADSSRRSAVEAAILRDDSAVLEREGRDRYGLKFILATSNGLEQAKDIDLDQLASRADLKTVYDRKFAAARVVIFEIRDRDGPT
jgi:hypothetical protein